MLLFVFVHPDSRLDLLGGEGLSIVEGRSLGGDVEEAVLFAQFLVDAGVYLLDILPVGILLDLVTVLDRPVHLLAVWRLAPLRSLQREKVVDLFLGDLVHRGVPTHQDLVGLVGGALGVRVDGGHLSRHELGAGLGEHAASLVVGVPHNTYFINQDPLLQPHPTRNDLRHDKQ